MIVLVISQQQEPANPVQVAASHPEGGTWWVRSGFLAIGLALLVVGVVVPFFGWAGLQTEGPAIGLGAGALLAVGGERRAISAVAGVGGAAAIALVILRLASEPTSPLPALQSVLREALSHGSLDVALIGAVFVTAVGVLQVFSPRALFGAWGPLSRFAPFPGDRAGRVALRDAAVALVLSRVLIWAVAVGAVILLGVHANLGPGAFDRPFGGVGRAIVAPATGWDTGAYLTIARSGYAGGPHYAPFFPLYPDLIRLFAWTPQSAVISGILISLFASLAGLYLLHRLVAEDYGERVARLTVLLIAFFPTSLFLSAVYTEPLFLATSIGAVYAARKDAWAWAGLSGAAAAACRSDGAVILVPLLLIYLYGPRPTPPSGSGGWLPRYRFSADAAWLLLVPVPILLFLAYMGIHGSWLAPLHAEHDYWGRTLIPFAGLWQGFSKAFEHVRNFDDAIFLLLALIALVVAIRTLPVAYWAYALVTILVPISTVTAVEPLESLPRFVLVSFPLWLALARWADQRRWRAPCLLIPSGIAMAIAAAIFARGGWIA